MTLNRIKLDYQKKIYRDSDGNVPNYVTDNVVGNIRNSEYILVWF